MKADPLGDVAGLERLGDLGWHPAREKARQVREVNAAKVVLPQLRRTE